MPLSEARPDNVTPVLSPLASRSSATDSRTIPGQAHVPAAPSALRNSQLPSDSPEDRHILPDPRDASPESPSSDPEGDGPDANKSDFASVDSKDAGTDAVAYTESGVQPHVRTRLLEQSQQDSPNHGATTTRPRLVGYGSMDTIGTRRSDDGFGSRRPGDGASVVDGPGDQKASITQWLAKRHGVDNRHLM